MYHVECKDTRPPYFMGRVCIKLARLAPAIPDVVEVTPIDRSSHRSELSVDGTRLDPELKLDLDAQPEAKVHRRRHKDKEKPKRRPRK